MNIFETLARGKGCINEENISSFLGYLLDPNEDHGLKNIFLNRFLQEIGISESEIEITPSNIIDIKLEFPVDVQKTTKSRRIIDIVFETSDHVIAIENKILESSKQKNQLQEEYNGLVEYCNNEKINKAIIMCFLSPEKSEENLKLNGNDCYKSILWKNILEILTEILKKESSAEINPLCDYLKQTLKGFINFMKNTLKPKAFDVKTGNYKGKYRIFKYSSGQIVLQQEKDEKWDCDTKIVAKPIIRAKLKELNIEYSKEANTRSLGAKLFKAIST